MLCTVCVVACHAHHRSVFVCVWPSRRKPSRRFSTGSSNSNVEVRPQPRMPHRTRFAADNLLAVPRATGADICGSSPPRVRGSAEAGGWCVVVPLARVGCRDTMPLQKEQSEQKLRALQRSLREVRGWLAAVAVMESLTSNSDREVQKETQVARLERETKKLRSALVRAASALVRVAGAYDNALASPPRTSSKMQTRLPKKPSPKSATWTRMVTWGRAWYVISDKPRRACCDVHGSWWLAMARGGSCAGIGELFAVPSC